jgi:hypothetical protein
MQPGYPNQPWGIWFFQRIVPSGPGQSFRRMMYDLWDRPFFKGDYSRKNAIEIFNNWNASVISKCPAEKLLIHDSKHGWEPLCKFLGVPIPDCPYPHVNDTAEFQKIIYAINISGYLLAGGLVATSAYLMRWLVSAFATKNSSQNKA